MRHHLAIVEGRYIDAILAGRKTIECRLGLIGSVPYGAVEAGDLIWFKEICGPVRGVASTQKVESFEALTPARVDWLRRTYNAQIGAPSSFWQAYQQARYATLVHLQEVCPLTPFRIQKRDRRAWVVLDEPPVPGQTLVRRSGWES